MEILFQINEDWDEGIGYDYEESGLSYKSGNYSIVKTPSNWFYKNTLDTWAVPGIYTTGATIVETIHFDNGNEDLDVDITSYVNGIITGSTNHGLGLAFAVVYQDLTPEVDRSVAFFTKYTQTFFEPFIETKYDDHIEDDRVTFYLGKTNKLFFYSVIDGKLENLDNLPDCTINGVNL